MQNQRSQTGVFTIELCVSILLMYQSKTVVIMQFINVIFLVSCLYWWIEIAVNKTVEETIQASCCSQLV